MIKIRKDGQIVKITFDTDLAHEKGGTTSFHFVHNCGDHQYAELLQKYMNDRLAKAIVEIRQKEYNRGWKDAKAKIKKEIWFYDGF